MYVSIVDRNLPPVLPQKKKNLQERQTFVVKVSVQISVLRLALNIGS